MIYRLPKEKGFITMTTFEKDYKAIIQDVTEAKDILMGRKETIEKLKKEQRACKNKFRWTCMQQEIERLQNEYRVLDDLI